MFKLADVIESLIWERETVDLSGISHVRFSNKPIHFKDVEKNIWSKEMAAGSEENYIRWSG
jgi:hypothetical protein